MADMSSIRMAERQKDTKEDNELFKYLTSNSVLTRVRRECTEYAKKQEGFSSLMNFLFVNTIHRRVHKE